MAEKAARLSQDFRNKMNGTMPAQTAIHITVNGEPVEHPADTTVAEFLHARGLDPDQPKGIAVAVNDEVIRKSDWASSALQEGDRVEVITARQGG